MALICCPECGKEISDKAKVCPNCGYRLINISDVITKNKPKITKIIVAVTILAVGILAISILSRPNIKMQSFRDNGILGTLIQYGIPTEIDDTDWEYEDCIEFYGIPVSNFLYDTVSHKCIMVFNDENTSEVKDLIKRHCEYEKGVLYLSYYSYKDLTVIADFSPFACIQIEFP